MSVVGRGRIVVWDGGSLWMMEGEHESAQLDQHAHHAIQITFRLGGWFDISVGDDHLDGPVAMVASDVRHGFRAKGAVAFLFVAPESPAGRALGRTVLADRPAANVGDADWRWALEALRHCYADGGAEPEMRRIGLAITEALSSAGPVAMPDGRALAMIAYATRNLENGVALPAAAGHVGLSASRARHLFVGQTGLPFRTYVLWLRIQRAVALYAAGKSLTAAAHEAGFADSAHFSRTFRRTFGLPAVALRLYHD
jgi:AraC-like DNA-binding protein